MTNNPLTRCFQQTQVRRSMRPAVQTSYSRSAAGAQQGMSQKTKYALCFLCLFDGLRTPSIRRLVRKPRTICDQPLLTFDPSYFAPKSRQAIRRQYSKLCCPCEIAVDPSVDTVTALLKKHTTSIPPQNVIIHYYGHGCHPPSEGCLFFFSSDRGRYKSIKIQNMINQCSCPLCFILDCPFAGILAPDLQMKPNIFAFMACSSSEMLPLSTDSPMDLFSCCLLSPFETSLMCHMRQHSSVYSDQREPKKDSNWLENLFVAILESILFDTQTQSVLEMFTKDPSIAALTRGFILAQRVMLSYNLHPLSIPALKPVASHPLWGFWDLALDFSVTLPEEEAAEMIFDLFIQSFGKFPNSGYFPLFSFLLKIHKFHEKTSKILFEYLDSDENIPLTASRSGIPSTIIEMSKPSEYSLLILSKIIAKRNSSVFNQQSPLNFCNSYNVNVIKYGLLAMCCAMANQFIPSPKGIMQLCIEHAVECAPYSCILLGQIISKAGRLLGNYSFLDNFVTLLKHEKSSIRAATVYLLGYSKEKEVVDHLIPLLKDESPLVRMQLIDAFIQFKYVFIEFSSQIENCLNQLQNDPDVDVRNYYKTASSNSADFNSQNIPYVLTLLVKSVSKPGFGSRMNENVFN